MDQLTSEKLDINAAVYVGGCSGNVTKIEDDKVYVTGVWHDFGSNYSEQWTVIFNKVEILEKCKVVHGQIDASAITSLEWC